MTQKLYIPEAEVEMTIFANINIDMILIFSLRRYRYIDMTSTFPSIKNRLFIHLRGQNTKREMIKAESAGMSQTLE